MAEARVSHDQFRCPVCLDLLKDPVTIPCGHSYCKSCITDCWNQESKDQKRDYSCPQCRQTFRPRPALNKNTMLAEVVEQLKMTEVQTEDEECDVCTERKHKAIKSCLMCRNSFCQNHLEQHENLFKGKGHDLIDATGRLKEMICHKHKKLMEIYCRTDQQCICMLCTMDEHKNHETVSTAAERTEKQKDLVRRQREFQQQIKEREKKFQELKEAVEAHKRSAQTAVEDSEMIFNELISSIERRCSEVTPMIRDREKTVVSHTEGLMERLEQEINELRRKNAELEQLSQTHDPTHFLQSFPSLPVPPGSPDVPNITDSSYDNAGESVFQMSKSLEDFCKKEIEKISGRVRCIQIIPTPEYKSREDFLNYFHRFTMDPNTAYKRLRLSEGNRVVTYSRAFQEYPDHPDRFDRYLQVLCRESVCGRCYWEVEWSGKDGVSISVSYKSISRKTEGGECRFGNNENSWSLICSPHHCAFRHNNNETLLPAVSSSCRIGVYVDHTAGILSFYSVSDTMNLIHRVQTTFTQPLYPGFGFLSRLFSVFFGLTECSTAKLCDV